MAPGASVTFNISGSGRLWGRTGCNTSTSPAQCATGQCGGTGLQCAGTTGVPNTSLFEFTINANGTDWYNVSYVDAIDNPITVTTSNTSCINPSSCNAAVKTNCPAGLRSGDVCLSPCTRYNTDQLCCRGAYGTPDTCNTSTWSSEAQTYLNNVHNYCPYSYAYAYDEPSGALRTCPTGTSYNVTFCGSGGSGSSSSGGGGNTVARVFQHCNYTGWSAAIAAGNFNLGSLQNAGFVNDDASSIQVAAGYEAVLYQHDNFTGSSIVVTGNDNCFVNENFNDVASSIITRTAGGGGGNPITIQAESYTDMNGVQTEPTTDTGGGTNVGWIDSGDWMAFPLVNLPYAGNYRVSYRVASPNGGGSLQIEQAGGNPVFGSISVPNTGGWQSWTTISHQINLPAGSVQLGIYVPAGGWNLNWLSITPL